MQLKRAGLAHSFNVSLNTISAWVGRGCPVASAGGRGVSSTFLWKDVAHWACKYKIWPGHAEPDQGIEAAFWRAKNIVRLRNKRKRKRP